MGLLDLNELRVVELFGGIGGFRLGLEKASSRFKIVWSNDNDKYACQIYRKRFASNRQQQGNTEIRGCGDSFGNKGKQSNQSEVRGDNITPNWHEPSRLYEGDIRTVDADVIPGHDLLCAGFPCQSFSIAGKRRGFEDTRGTLFFEICRIIRAKRTPYLLLENVKGLLSHDEGNTFQTIIRTLDDLGYDCQWEVLNSKDFGVPQNRERVFIIGHLRGQPRPKVFPVGETDEVYSETNRRISHAIDSNYHKGWLDNQQRTMVIQSGVRTAGKLRYYNDEIPAMAQAYGTGGGNVPMVVQPVLTPDRDNSRIRRLTPTECERLQGFPDGWTEGISDTQRYKCLGNAVTVNVIEAIGRHLNESTWPIV